MSTKPGNNRAYLLRRLSRDAPLMLDAVESGKLSARAAAIKAGIVKVDPPRLAVLKAAKKLPAADRKWLIEQLE